MKIMVLLGRIPVPGWLYTVALVLYCKTSADRSRIKSPRSFGCGVFAYYSSAAFFWASTTSEMYRERRTL